MNILKKSFALVIVTLVKCFISIFLRGANSSNNSPLSVFNIVLSVISFERPSEQSKILSPSLSSVSKMSAFI